MPSWRVNKIVMTLIETGRAETAADFWMSRFARHYEDIAYELSFETEHEPLRFGRVNDDQAGIRRVSHDNALSQIEAIAKTEKLIASGNMNMTQLQLVERNMKSANTEDLLGLWKDINENLRETMMLRQAGLPEYYEKTAEPNFEDE